MFTKIYNIPISIAQCTGEIRLVDGDSERDGRLEVCLNQRWGTVCNTGWSLPDSRVVCKQLGYSASGRFPCTPMHTHIHSMYECMGTNVQYYNCRGGQENLQVRKAQNALITSKSMLK